MLNTPLFSVAYSRKHRNRKNRRTQEYYIRSVHDSCRIPPTKPNARYETSNANFQAKQILHIMRANNEVSTHNLLTILEVALVSPASSVAEPSKTRVMALQTWSARWLAEARASQIHESQQQADQAAFINQLFRNIIRKVCQHQAKYNDRRMYHDHLNATTCSARRPFPHRYGTRSVHPKQTRFCLSYASPLSARIRIDFIVENRVPQEKWGSAPRPNQRT